MTKFIREMRTIGIPDVFIEKIIRHFSGNPIYVQKVGVIKSKEERNSEIYSKFNGKNYRELSIEYDLSFQRIHAIIRNERAKYQHDLFA